MSPLESKSDIPSALWLKWKSEKNFENFEIFKKIFKILGMSDFDAGGSFDRKLLVLFESYSNLQHGR